jgi:hypothetical protein
MVPLGAVRRALLGRGSQREVHCGRRRDRDRAVAAEADRPVAPTAVARSRSGAGSGPARLAIVGSVQPGGGCTPSGARTSRRGARGWRSAAAVSRSRLSPSRRPSARTTAASAAGPLRRRTPRAGPGAGSQSGPATARRLRRRGSRPARRSGRPGSCRPGPRRRGCAPAQVAPCRRASTIPSAPASAQRESYSTPSPSRPRWSPEMPRDGALPQVVIRCAGTATPRVARTR